MIAIDTSSMIAFLRGQSGSDVQAIDRALEQRAMVFPPVVLTELLSDPKLDAAVASLLKDIPTLGLVDGFWQRAGGLRASIIARGYKARLADALIAQSCIDHELPLVSRDTDFRHFARFGDLRLAK